MACSTVLADVLGEDGEGVVGSNKVVATSYLSMETCSAFESFCFLITNGSQCYLLDVSHGMMVIMQTRDSFPPSLDSICLDFYPSLNPFLK